MYADKVRRLTLVYFDYLLSLFAILNTKFVPSVTTCVFLLPAVTNWQFSMCIPEPEQPWPRRPRPKTINKSRACLGAQLTN